MSIALSSAQPRHVFKRQELIAEEDLLLVELPSAGDLESVKQHGATLKAHGDAGDGLVLCTSADTLTCKHVQTTNLLLLCDITQEGEENLDANLLHRREASGLMSQLAADAGADRAPPITITAKSSFTVETSKRVLPVEQLHACLLQHTFDGKGADAMETCGDVEQVAGMAWQALRSTVLACDAHIVQALHELRALAVHHQRDGWRWHRLAPTLRGEALEALLLTCAEHELPLHRFRPSQLFERLHAATDSLSQLLAAKGGFLAWHILRTFCKPASARSQQILRHAELPSGAAQPRPAQLDADALLAFDQDCVAHEFALHAAGASASSDTASTPSIERAQVFAAWQERMPPAERWRAPSEGAAAAKDMGRGGGGLEGGAGAPGREDQHALFARALHGAAIEQPGSRGAKLLLLRAETLSLDAKARFAQLFAVKPQWAAAEILPYLQGVYAEGCKNASELLLKFTRAVRERADAPALHCAR